jgi:hypothetical protein
LTPGRKTIEQEVTEETEDLRFLCLLLLKSRRSGQTSFPQM